MSHYMTALAMKQKGLKPAAKIVLYWLADHHNSETGKCFPSLKTLAGECEMDVATVKRHLKHLEDMGIIRRHQRHRENGSQTSTQYTLQMIEPLAQNAPPPSAKCPNPLAQKRTPHNLVNNNHVSEPETQSPVDILCKIVRHETATDFSAHRKAMKKPLTVEAARRLVKKLSSHPDPDAVFDMSIENGWQGVFPEKIGGQNGARTYNTATTTAFNKQPTSLASIVARRRNEQR